MRCDRITVQTSDGTVVKAIMCNRGVRPRSCQVPGCTTGGRSVAQCDYPVERKGRKSKTCDLHLCKEHQHPVEGAHNIDYCPAHERLARDSQRATEPGLLAGAGRGAAAPADGAHNGCTTPTHGGADAPGTAGGGTAASGPGEEPPRVILRQLDLFGAQGGAHG